MEKSSKQLGVHLEFMGEDWTGHAHLNMALPAGNSSPWVCGGHLGDGEEACGLSSRHSTSQGWLGGRGSQKAAGEQRGK